MKKLLALSAIVAIISMNSGCRKIEMDGDKVVSGSGGNGNSTEENTILEGRISANRTL